MIELVNASALATIQDMGRVGYYRDGVGRAGAMDRVALAIGNALLGNDADAAAVEFPMPPFKVRFHADLDIALTGADCEATLDDTPFPPDWAGRVTAGQVLSAGPPKSGCRAYLCVAGGVDVPIVLGSRSTQLREGFGGFEGRPLQKGDQLRARGSDRVIPEGGMGATPAEQALPLGDGRDVCVRVLPAAEYERFRPEAREQFWQAGWEITQESNRTGYRLSGPELSLEDKLELRSHGLVPGVIQVPSGGQPIIQIADAATMGGYPKIGTVIDADLWRVAQARAGEILRFIETDYAGAIAAQEELTAFLTGVRLSADHQRGAAERWAS